MKKFNRDIMDILESVVVALLAVMIIFTLVCRVYVVDGPSMNSTLAHGDRLLVSQLFYQPKQGDIVCFVAENHQQKVLVKRIIATAGQTVDITADFKVMVDGVVLDETYVDTVRDHCYDLSHDAGCTHANGAQFPYTVQEGEVFVMGDNRDNSTDSRQLGAVEEKYLLGKMLIRIFPNTGVVK